MSQMFVDNKSDSTKAVSNGPVGSVGSNPRTIKKPYLEMVSDVSATNPDHAKRGNISTGEKSTASGSNLGRRGDPRMHKAVAARVTNPSISLLEALVEGGFEFPDYCEGSGKSDRDIFDTDGVQLCQRKNQLSRRLRLMRKRGEAEASVVRSNSTAAASHPASVPFAASNGTTGEDGNTFNPFSTDALLSSQTLGVNMSPQLMNLMLLQQQQQSLHQEPNLTQNMPGVDSSRLLVNAMQQQQQQQQLQRKRPLEPTNITDHQSSNGGVVPLVQNLQMPQNNYVGLDNAGNAVATMQATMFNSGGGVPVSSNYLPYASFLSQNNFHQPSMSFQVPIPGGDKKSTSAAIGGTLPNNDLNRFLGIAAVNPMGLGGEQQQMQALMKNGFQDFTKQQDPKSAEADSNTNLNTTNSFLIPASTHINSSGKIPDMIDQTEIDSPKNSIASKIALAVNLFKAERQDLIEKCLSKVGLDPHDSSTMQDFELKLASCSEHHLEL